LRQRNTQRHTQVFIVIAILAGSVSTTIFGLSLLHPSTNDKPVVVINTPSSALPIQPNQTVYSFPSRLTIPKIGVNANVIQMGITSTGSMQAPATNQATGWYKYGARPGNVGSAVIDGHLGLSNEAVFGKLDKLVVGDAITVLDDQGSTISFIVKRIATFERDSDAAAIFNSETGSHLNLITCNGDWESHQATYSKRLVVFSDAVPKVTK
jgi:LPXTG-site transpeptidase (sortase) family protein